MSEGRFARGFSLIEVMVALAILAAVAGGALAFTSQTTRLAASVREQSFAAALADNVLVERVITSLPLEEGVETIDRDFAGVAWRVAVTTTNVGTGGLVRIDVAVTKAGAAQVLAAGSTLRRPG
ncbi:MAG: type II secretion system minor pseudopilin GspI [Pseudomonadota bacterium]